VRITKCEHARAKMPTRYVEEVVYKWLCDQCSLTFESEVQCVLHERNVHNKDRQCVASSAQLAITIDETSEASDGDAQSTLDEIDDTMHAPEQQSADSTLSSIVHRAADTTSSVSRPGRFIVPPKRYQLRLSGRVESKPKVNTKTRISAAADVCSSSNVTTTATCKTEPHILGAMCAVTGDDKKSLAAQSPRPFECKLCRKAFKQYAHLWQHNKIVHENSRRFVCDICEKSFHLNEGLTRHRRLHTNEKPFECAECGERFSQMGHARRHAQTHTGERPHPCPVCAKPFTRATDVRRHLLCVHKHAVDYVLPE